MPGPEMLSLMGLNANASNPFITGSPLTATGGGGGGGLGMLPPGVLQQLLGGGGQQQQQQPQFAQQPQNPYLAWIIQEMVRLRGGG